MEIDGLFVPGRYGSRVERRHRRSFRCNLARDRAPRAPAASVRAMAPEMGCATGVLSLHYRAKDDIAALACNEATRTIVHRITAVEPGCDPVDLETGTRPGLLVWAER